ncbi:MAG TPA: TonB-dependent receptor [Acidobacteriaceae bacterium]|nr:TonB-dependent receptor [Acidobacteriaceae bacterium]
MQRVPLTLSVKQDKSIVSTWIPRVLVALLMCAPMLSRPAAAQQGQQFVGHIEDSSHASVPGAIVTLHNEGTGEDIVVKSSGAGDYTVPYVKVGTYSITVDRTGFKTVTKSHISLDTDQNSKIDFTLPVGEHTETVTVNSSGSQIDLSKADRGDILDNERVNEMPMDGRNVLELFELSPGTINNHSANSTRPEDNVSGDLYANGGAVVGSGAAVQENIDGATNDNANGYLGYPPPPDSVAEFKVVLNPYDASYGRAGGGAIDISLKSGTNKIHGDIYEYARRPFLDAQTYVYDYNKSLPNQCPPLPAAQPTNCISPGVRSNHSRDQFGAELDGPVYIPHIYNGKDKTFFAMQWEQQYETLPATGASVNSVPDPDWLAGNFGSTPILPTGIEYFATPTQPKAGTTGNSPTNLLGFCATTPSGCNLPLGIFDPVLPVQSNVNDPNSNKLKYARQQFPGNNCGDTSGVPITCVIPQDPNDPSQATGRAIAHFYSLLTPNHNPGPGYAPFQNNFFFLPLEYDVARNGLVKIDHNFGPRDRGTVRWEGFERFSNNLNSGIPANNPANNETFTIQPKDNNFAIDEIHTFSPNLILDNKISLLNEKQGAGNGSRIPGVLNLLDMSQHYIQNAAYTNIFPSVTAKNPFDMIALGGSVTNNNISHNLAYQPTFTYVHGRHTFHGGLDMRLYQYANPGGGSSNQSLSFTAGQTNHYVNGSNDESGFQSGSGLASMLLGYLNGAGIKYAIDVFDSQHFYGIWAQDDWKVTPKLTLNLGLRYDLLGARTERHNRLNYAFDTNVVNTQLDSELPSHAGLSGPLMGGIRFAGINGNPRGAYATNLLNLQPRFGAAYAFSSRTSLRLGFGEMFINNESNDSTNGFSSSATGYTNSVFDSVTGIQTYNTYPYGHANDPFPAYVQPTGSSLGYLTTPGASINFSDPNYKVPSIWQYSASLEQLLTRRDTLEIAFSGSRGYNVTDSLQINNVSAAWNARCDIERGGDRQLCDSSAQGPANAPNPFKGVPAFLGTSYYTNPLISTNNFTRPFPAFTGISQDNSPFVHTWYNSLQVIAVHNVSRSLTAHFAYTYSKTMKAGQVIDATNGVFGRTISANDTPNVITLSAVYYLPVGRGKTFFGRTNRITDALIGGWEISPLYVYTEGKPLGIGNNWEYVAGPLAVKAHDLPPDATHAFKRVQGMTPCVAYKDPDNGSLQFGPSYTNANCSAPRLIKQPNGYQIPLNMVYSGVRVLSTHEFDANISKRFAWNERANLQIRLDAFNVLNHPNFNNGYSTSQNSADFGTFNKNGNPSGPPRDLQLSGKLTF